MHVIRFFMDVDSFHRPEKKERIMPVALIGASP